MGFHVWDDGKAVNHVVQVLEDESIRFHIHRLRKLPGDGSASIWISTGVILAVPTYEYKMFPPAAAVLEESERKGAKPQKHFSWVPLDGRRS